MCNRAVELYYFIHDTETSVDLSVDLADTVELSKRLLEIINLNDPQEAEEELKKLKDELNARSK